MSIGSVWLKFNLNVKIDKSNITDSISDGDNSLSGLSNIYFEVERWYNSLNKIDLMKDISQQVDYIIKENFEQQGRSESGTSGTWAEWSNAWIKRRQKMNKYPGMILQLKGHLKGSLSATDFTENSFLYGSNVDYAAFHEFGMGVPARPFLVVPETDYDFITEAIIDFFAFYA